MEHKEAIKILKNAQGQLNAALKMAEDGRYCVDISRQIIAVQGLLKKANLRNLEHHINTCVVEAIEGGSGDQKISEVIDLIDKYIK